MSFAPLSAALLIFSFAQYFPYSLKDLRMGMELAAFKATYPYKAAGTKPTDPAFSHGALCSDDDPVYATPPHLAKARQSAGLTDCLLITTHGPQPGQLPLTLGNVKLESMRLWFLDKELYRLAATINQSDTRALVEAIEGKYGPSKVTAMRTLQNAFGARFEASDFSWSNGKESLLIREHFPDLKTTTLLLVDIEREREAIRKEPKQSSDI